LFLYKLGKNNVQRYTSEFDLKFQQIFTKQQSQISVDLHETADRRQRKIYPSNSPNFTNEQITTIGPVFWQIATGSRKTPHKIKLNSIAAAKSQ
jgi:hypothetical protein